MLKWIALGTSSFIFFVVLVFGIMLMVNPPQKKTPAKSRHLSKIHKKGKKISYASEKDSLRAVAEEFELLTNEKQRQLDSLRKVISMQTAQLEERNKKIEQLTVALKGKADKDKRAKDMAKTLAAMKLKQMAPILNKLDDATLISIFQQTSKTARSTILSALSDERAARITKKLIN